jgi:apolipoprotein N-acyltransferase
MPLSGWLPMKKITAGSIDLSAGPGPQTIALAGLPAFSPNVCYEAIFPGAVVDQRARPAWILNVTNDAWYGRSSGPYQHFAIARTRAIEEGLPLVRVANNGISGVIDPLGRIIARTGLNDITYADIALPPPGPPTLYAAAGDWIFLAMLALGLLPALPRRR